MNHQAVDPAQTVVWKQDCRPDIWWTDILLLTYKIAREVFFSHLNHLILQTTHLNVFWIHLRHWDNPSLNVFFLHFCITLFWVSYYECRSCYTSTSFTVELTWLVPLWCQDRISYTSSGSLTSMRGWKLWFLLLVLLTPYTESRGAVQELLECIIYAIH